jgi:hypothetical protein
VARSKKGAWGVKEMVLPARENGSGGFYYVQSANFRNHTKGLVSRIVAERGQENQFNALNKTNKRAMKELLRKQPFAEAMSRFLLGEE